MAAHHPERYLLHRVSPPSRRTSDVSQEMSCLDIVPPLFPDRLTAEGLSDHLHVALHAPVTLILIAVAIDHRRRGCRGPDRALVGNIPLHEASTADAHQLLVRHHRFPPPTPTVSDQDHLADPAHVLPHPATRFLTADPHQSMNSIHGMRTKSGRL